jgi:tetratricopeptide (TPR) repeat protein
MPIPRRWQARAKTRAATRGHNFIVFIYARLLLLHCRPPHKLNGVVARFGYGSVVPGGKWSQVGPVTVRALDCDFSDELLLILLMCSRFGPPTVNSLDRGLRLQATANRLVKSGKLERALKLYETHIYAWRCVPSPVPTETAQEHVCTARSFLLLALTCQRLGLVSDARAAFREGARRFESTAAERECVQCRAAAAQLYQSWGLMESKLGHYPLAWALVTKAVVLDKSNAAVLKWALWKQHLKPHMRKPRLVLKVAMKNTHEYRPARKLPAQASQAPSGAPDHCSLPLRGYND